MLVAIAVTCLEVALVGSSAGSMEETTVEGIMVGGVDVGIMVERADGTVGNLRSTKLRDIFSANVTVSKDK